MTATDTASTPNTTTKSIPVIVTVPANSGELTWGSIDDNRYTWTKADAGCKARAGGTWRLPTIAELSANSDAVRTALPADGKNSVVWSSDDANDSGRKMGWRYFEDPNSAADSTAQAITEGFYFICVHN